MATLAAQAEIDEASSDSAISEVEEAAAKERYQQAMARAEAAHRGEG
jgi:hypothetical protein